MIADSASSPEMSVHSHPEHLLSGMGRSGGESKRSTAEVCLILVSGSASTNVLDLTERSHASIGRQLENCIVVPDATCSRRHCVLTRLHQVWFIEDLFSRNGTFVNGQRIYNEYPLCNGDVVQIGCTRFQFTEIVATDA